MACLCSPTTHAGSFRCRLHRSDSWDGRSMPKARTSGSDLEVFTASLLKNSHVQEDQKPVMAPPVAAPPPPSFFHSPSARSPPTGSNRLQNMVCSFNEEDKTPLPTTERMASMKMASGTGGSFASAPGRRAAMFKMLKTSQSTSEILS